MEKIDWSPDKVNSISSASGRLVHDGVRAVEVRSNTSTKTQVAALMDLLDLHLNEVSTGSTVDPGRVAVRVPAPTSEALGAMGTLTESLLVDLRVDILRAGDGEQLAPQVGVDGHSAWRHAEVGWDAADRAEYPTWPALLSRPRPVPDLLVALVRGVDTPALRAYPMLSSRDGWSLRLEGLEVARVRGERIRLNVGRDGKLGGRSLQRSTWIAATGAEAPLETDDVAAAARLIRRFSAAWRDPDEIHHTQDEHALESRILRGATPIPIGRTSLDLIQPDPVVNWGSQFPTKWGPGGSSRYLDALLRSDATPWAIEMKVEGGGGIGQYYRHAVAQAVLYREFIRRATPLHFWFSNRDLDAARCQAAVVVPRISQPAWAARLRRLCEAFGVRLVEVDPAHASRH
jgi:hypothetical protein